MFFLFICILKTKGMIRVQSYSKLVKAVVAGGDTLLCGVIFELFCCFLKGTHWEKTLAAPEEQIILTLMLCYLLCSMQRPIILYKRKVYAYQIVRLVFLNVLSFAVLSGAVLAIGQYMDVYSYFFLWYIMAVFLCSATFRLLCRFIIKSYRLRGKNQHAVVLVGSGENNLRLYYELTGQQWAGYVVVGYFDNRPNPLFPAECTYWGRPEEVIGFLKKHPHVRSVFCGLAAEYREVIMSIVNYCENNVVHFYSVPDLHSYLQNRVYFNRMGTVPYLSLRPEPLSCAGNKILKRGFDILFSLVFLCTLFPLIYVVVAIITKCTMPGPVFFKQKRNGVNDREFYCYKFRSMKVNKDADRVQATKGDARVTRWGHILRKTNLDETPQFVNVLLGDMSIVGPRPHMLKHTEEYSRLINKYMVRHFVKPGVTGWSQVSGFRGETKELSDMENRIKNDIWYIEHWSFSLDLYIIYKTVANIIQGEKNAY